MKFSRALASIVPAPQSGPMVTEAERAHIGTILHDNIEGVNVVFRLMARWYQAQTAIAMSANASPEQREIMPYLTAMLGAIETEVRAALDAVERMEEADAEVEDESVQGIPDQALDHWPDIFGDRQ